MNSSSEKSLFDLIDDGKLSRAQIILIALCALIALLDGFDTQAIGFVAPAIAKDWSIPLSQFGVIFAMGLVGGLIGALACGALADKIGRRQTLIITIAIFAAGSLLTATASTVSTLVFYRTITGFGLGGALPSLIALTSEYSPASRRTMLIATMFCGFPLGAVVGAILSGPVIEHFGWVWVFVAGGVLPLLLLPPVINSLPESLSWLIKRQRRAEANEIVAKMNKAPLPENLSADFTETKQQYAFARSIFGEGRAIGSVLLAATFFISLLISYLLVSWLPSIATEAGLTIKLALLTAAILNLAGIIGSLAIGALSDRLGPNRIISGGYFLGAGLILGLAVLNMAANGVFLFSLVAGLLCIGAQMCLVSVAAQFYPATMRGTGVGWCMGMGRIGAITGPLVGAILVSEQGRGLYPLVAALSFAAGLGVLAIGLIYADHRQKSI